MIKILRQLNVDHLTVGFYQLGPGGASISRANIDNSLISPNRFC